MNLTGKWSGYYEFGASYMLPFFGERVKFTIDLKDDESTLTGDSTEEPSDFAIKYPAEIRGFVDNDYVSIVRVYPFIPVVQNDSSKITYEEGEIEVEYEGYLDADKETIYGVWSMMRTLINPETEEKMNLQLSGIWLLKKD